MDLGRAVGFGLRGQFCLQPQIVVETDDGVDEHRMRRCRRNVGCICRIAAAFCRRRGFAAGDFHGPFTGFGRRNRKDDIAPFFGDLNVFCGMDSVLIPEKYTFAVGLYQSDLLQELLVFRHEGDVYGGVGYTVIGDGKSFVKRRITEDLLYRFGGRFRFDEHLQELAVQVGLSGQQYVGVGAVFLQQPAAGGGHLVDKDQKCRCVFNRLLCGQCDDIEISAGFVDILGDLNGILVGADVVRVAEGIRQVVQVIDAVRQKDDAGTASFFE